MKITKSSTKRTLLLILEKDPGVLVRIVGLITRRRFNLENLVIADCENKNYNKLLIVIKNEQQGSDQAVLQLIKQLQKLINIVKVQDISFLPTIQRELLLVKIKVTPHEQSELVSLVPIYGFTVIDISLHTISLEFVGESNEVINLENLLKNYEILEFIKTGPIGLVQDSRIPNQYQIFEKPIRYTSRGENNKI